MSMPEIKKLPIKVFQGIFEYLLFLPILLIIGINVVNADQLWKWLLSIFLLFTIGVIFRTLIPYQKWWLFTATSIFIGVSSSFIFEEHLLYLIILAIIHTIVVYRGMMYASQPCNILLSISFFWMGGLTIYFVGYSIFWFIETLNPYLNQLTVFGVILIIMTMFVANDDHLKTSTLSSEKKPFVSKPVQNQNRIFLAMTIVIIALIANGKIVRDVLWNIFKTSINWLLKALAGTVKENGIEEPPPPIDFSFLSADEEPSATMKFLEVLLMYAMYIILGIVAIVIVLLLIKKTRIWIVKLIRQIIQFLKRILSQITERNETTQYTEEKESVFDWQEWKDEQQSKAKGFIQNIFKRKPSWNSLSNQEKVRFVFKNFLLQEIDVTTFSRHATPRETLEQLKLTAQVEESQLDQLRMAYEQTRYGEQDIDEQIINEIYTLINKK